MSYIRRFEYKIAPVESYQIIRNCSVCGCKSNFVSSNNFRVNANGNRIDIWLIYQCKKCKHTYNLTIYERQKVDNLSSNHFESYMENDKELAKKYGTDKSFFVRNKAEIDWSCMKYQIMNTKTQELVSDEQIIFHSGDFIQIDNPCGLKVRTDKILADIFHITRNAAKKLEEIGDIKILKNSPSPNINIILYGDIYTD